MVENNIEKNAVAVHTCKGKLQTMDDMQTVALSVLALHDVELPDKLQEMWGHLHKAVLCLLRFRQSQHQPQHLEEAQNEMLLNGHLVHKACSMLQWGENKKLRFLDFRNFDVSKTKRAIDVCSKMIPKT